MMLGNYSLVCLSWHIAHVMYLCDQTAFESSFWLIAKQSHNSEIFIAKAEMLIVYNCHYANCLCTGKFSNLYGSCWLILDVVPCFVLRFTNTCLVIPVREGCSILTSPILSENGLYLIGQKNICLTLKTMILEKIGW